MEREIRDLLDAYPVNYAFGRGRRHAYVKITLRDGQSFKSFFAGTASDWRATQNQLGTLRRTLRRMGVEREKVEG